ncbi:unnamed protein product [Arctia plantaginis]|uniref:Uncharacterized protein n=1 Tax=Arctia plantaginis TaxID=874455 RepID=A0A8S1BH83_ARCPL|nr:unnamed protein product [Arctia plantaginis]
MAQTPAAARPAKGSLQVACRQTPARARIGAPQYRASRRMLYRAVGPAPRGHNKAGYAGATRPPPLAL